MEIAREENAKVLVELAPHLILVDEDARGVFLQQAAFTMTNAPGEIFVCTAREGGELRAFVIAQAGRSTKYVWISQCWSDSLNGWDTADKILSRLMLWTVAMGRKAIRGEIRRDDKAISRRFSFEPIAQIIEHKIPDELIERLSP